MANRCEKCNKKGQRGNLVSHSKRRTKHVYKPNLRSAKIMINGKYKRMKLCTDCLSREKKNNKVFKFLKANNETNINKSPIKNTTPDKNTKPIEEIKKIELKEKQTITAKKQPVKSKKDSDLELADRIIRGELEEPTVKEKKSKRVKKTK